MKKLFPLLLLLLIALSGCIRESTLSYERVEMASLQGVDVDGDGLFDISLYYYTPLSLSTGEEEIRVDRLIYVRPIRFSITAEGRNGSKELLEARAARALEKAEENVGQCRKVLCYSRGECEAKGGDAWLSLLSLSQLFGEFDKAKGELTTALIQLDEGDSKALYSAMAKLMLYEKAIALHPAVAYFHLCQVGKDYAHYEPITAISFSPEAHEALEVMAFKPTRLESIAQITVKETLPFGISEKVERLEGDGKVTSRVPLTIAYPVLKLTESEPRVLSLLVAGAFPNDKALFQHWKGVSLNVRLAMVEVPYLDEGLAQLGQLYRSLGPLPPYLKLALAFSLLTALLLALDFLISFAFGFTTLYLRGRNVGAAFRGAIGYIDPAWKRKLAFAFLLISAGFALEYLLSPEPVEDFSLAELRAKLEAWEAFIAFILYFSGIYFLLYTARDRFKAALGGTVSKERVRKALERLEESIGKVKALLEEMSAEGFDVSEEYEAILAVPLEKMKRMVGKDNLKLSQLVFDYSRKVEEIRAKLENERRMAKANWEEWEGYLREALAGRERVSIDSLIAIPKPWRLWAVQRYIDLHPEENLYIDGRVIVREQLSMEEKLRRLLARFPLKAFLALENGKALFIHAEPEDYLIKVLLYKIATSTEGEELEVVLQRSRLYMVRKGPYTFIGWGQEARKHVGEIARRV